MRELLLHNWLLKVVALGAAVILWKVAASSPSETAVTVPLQFRNIPPRAEVYGDGATSVEVRLRGPSTLLRTTSAEDVSLAIDLRGIELGKERVLPLTPDLVQAPLGLEAVRVTPSRVSFTVERTLSKTVRIVPAIEGNPPRGFDVVRTVAVPAEAEIQGPASHIMALEEIATAAIPVSGKNMSFTQTVDLDIPDSTIRTPKATVVKVEVEIRRSTR